MAQPVILGRVGAHVLDQLELLLALVESPGTGVGLGVWLRTVEVAIPFASSDGSGVSPTTIVVGEMPLPPAQAREQLLSLDQPVLVASADLLTAPAHTRGQLVLRVVLPKSPSPHNHPNDHNPTIGAEQTPWFV